ncbi:MAG: Tim44 domain-containing protein [Burkholderiaceae bacterium]|jgi:predicted lipid-binding transport protein (Tim44 family)
MLEALMTSRAVAQKGAALLTGLLTVVSLSLVPASQVEAKKFGGGMSIGKSAPMKKAAPPAAPAAPSAATPAKPNAAQTPGNAPAGQAAAAPAAGAAGTAAAAGAATRSSWMGPLVGIAAGLGLAALASHLGLGEELMSLLLIVLFVVAALFIVRLIMSRGRSGSGMPEPAMARSSGGFGGGQMSGGQWPSQPEADSRPSSAQGFDRSAGVQAPKAVFEEPASTAAQTISQDDIEAFLHVARQQFMAMQRFWDSGDLGQIESFCTPAMALEIRRQLDERGDAPNQTSVVQLDLEWLGLEFAQDDEGADVEEAYIRFYGLVREESDGTANGFDEVWLLQKRTDGASGWLLAGITQQGSSH